MNFFFHARLKLNFWQELLVLSPFCICQPFRIESRLPKLRCGEARAYSDSWQAAQNSDKIHVLDKTPAASTTTKFYSTHLASGWVAVFIIWIAPSCHFQPFEWKFHQNFQLGQICASLWKARCQKSSDKLVSVEQQWKKKKALQCQVIHISPLSTARWQGQCRWRVTCHQGAGQSLEQEPGEEHKRWEQGAGTLGAFRCEKHLLLFGEI